MANGNSSDPRQPRELNIAREVAHMEKMTVGELRELYAEVFGEGTNGRHKQWLIKRIAWRMQANVEGDLSERARRKALEIANDADLRTTPPKDKKVKPINAKSEWDPRLPGPGHRVQRDYKGRSIEVVCCADGRFEYQGEFYRSLSAIAKEVTGKHWNGFHFFNLHKNGGAK